MATDVPTVAKDGARCLTKNIGERAHRVGRHFRHEEDGGVLEAERNHPNRNGGIRVNAGRRPMNVNNVMRRRSEMRAECAQLIEGLKEKLCIWTQLV